MHSMRVFRGGGGAGGCGWQVTSTAKGSGGADGADRDAGGHSWIEILSMQKFNAM